MLEPIPFVGMVEIDLPVKTFVGNKPNYVTDNEPVAWIDEINTFVLDKDYKQFSKSLQNGMIPLYAHPAKTLTNEEIMELFYPFDLNDEAWVEDAVLIKFARAILRKAQEK